MIIKHKFSSLCFVQMGTTHRRQQKDSSHPAFMRKRGSEYVYYNMMKKSLQAITAPGHRKNRVQNAGQWENGEAMAAKTGGANKEYTNKMNKNAKTT